MSPIATNPKGVFSAVLEIDRDEPKESQPTFYFRPMTMQQYTELNVWVENLDQVKGVTVAIGELCSMICKYLVKWENMKDHAGKVIRFNRKRLSSIITINEGWEIIGIIKNQGLGFDDQKNLSLPSTSNTGQSVKNAPVKKSAKISRRR